MIDMHTHILWGVDDGADSLETAGKLLSQCVSQGVDCVVCTPHQDKMIHRTEELRCEFDSFLKQVSDIPVRLYLGAEILYYDGMVNDLVEGELLTMGGTNYVLVEFPVTCTSEDICNAVYELSLANYVAIVAHIERYINLAPQDYFAIKNEGALIQINASAFAHKGLRRKIKYLLKNKLIDFIASDCHDLDYRNVDFSEAREYVKKKFPKQYDKLFNRKFD